MDYTIISVPDMNDSFSRVVLDGSAYQIRFTYNDTGGYWTFGLYDEQRNPIAEGLKIVPQFPLNLFCSALTMGSFGVLTEQPRIGRGDFIDGKAKFIFIPAGGETT